MPLIFPVWDRRETVLGTWMCVTEPIAVYRFIKNQSWHTKSVAQGVHELSRRKVGLACTKSQHMCWKQAVKWTPYPVAPPRCVEDRRIAEHFLPVDPYQMDPFRCNPSMIIADAKKYYRTLFHDVARYAADNAKNVNVVTKNWMYCWCYVVMSSVKVDDEFAWWFGEWICMLKFNVNRNNGIAGDVVWWFGMTDLEW